VTRVPRRNARSVKQITSRELVIDLRRRLEETKDALRESDGLLSQTRVALEGLAAERGVLLRQLVRAEWDLTLLRRGRLDGGNESQRSPRDSNGALLN
jgi:hypothetical protein